MVVTICYVILNKGDSKNTMLKKIWYNALSKEKKKVRKKRRERYADWCLHLYV
jgi:hypothetical protein